MARRLSTSFLRSAWVRCPTTGESPSTHTAICLVFQALSENLTKRPLLRNFLHPLNREELDVDHRHPLGLQQQIPQVLIAPAAVTQHTNVPVHRFHHSEAYLRAAVVHYTFEVFE